MRAFIAISPGDETKAALAQLQSALRLARPLPPENLHLTLVFLDDQPEETLAILHEELLTVSARAFSVILSGAQRFGPVLAIEVASKAPLVALHRDVQSATRRAGIVLPRRRFRPHVTIARLRSVQEAGHQHSLSTDVVGAVLNMQITGFTLYNSTLRPEGARHDALAHYALT